MPTHTDWLTTHWDQAESVGIERPVQVDPVLQAGIDSGHVVIVRVDP